MKTKITLFAIVILINTSCSDHGNTGNGSMDTGVKSGSGYSDSLNPERGQLDTSTTPNESKKDRAGRH